MSIAVYHAVIATISMCLSCAFAIFLTIALTRKIPVPIVAWLVGAGLCVGMVLYLVFCPWLLCMVFAMAIGFIFWDDLGWRPSSFLGMSLALIIALHSISAHHAFSTATRIQQLRDEFAFENMEARVPAPRRRERSTPIISKEAEISLVKFEFAIKDEYSPGRAYSLKQLHENGVVAFIQNTGFGVLRMPPLTRERLISELREEKSVAQRGKPFSSPTYERKFPREGLNDDPGQYREMHYSSLIDFINVRGFGFIEARQKVAGFRSHQFSKPIEFSEAKVRSVELVGLLMNETPVVYVSDMLPNMANARTAPKRPLNAFESAGLEKLHGGDDLFIRRTKEGIRMLGAIRSVDVCVQCHGGERGNLLGAFSYSIDLLDK